MQGGCQVGISPKPARFRLLYIHMLRRTFLQTLPAAAATLGASAAADRPIKLGFDT